MLAQVGNALRHPVLIRLDQAGMTDFRIAPLHRPWAEIDWQPYPGAEFAEALLVNANYPKGTVFWTYRLLARFYELLAMPAYPILTMGTGLSGIELAESFGRFKPPVPQGGTPGGRWRRARQKPGRP